MLRSCSYSGVRKIPEATTFQIIFITLIASAVACADDGESASVEKDVGVAAAETFETAFHFTVQPLVA